MIHDSFPTPSEKIFEEIKGACIDAWNTHDNTYGLVDEKLFISEQVHNHGANVMLLLNMFDPYEREHIINNLSSETRDYINHYYRVYEEKGFDPERDN